MKKRIPKNVSVVLLISVSQSLGSIAVKKRFLGNTISFLRL